MSTSKSENDGDKILQHPLLRDDGIGMNPVSLLTGFYGARGERIRHRVHEGALRLPEEALEIYQESATNVGTNESKTNHMQQRYVLPTLDSVKRPSLDDSKPFYTVTEVHREETVEEDIQPDGTVQKRIVYRMVASNRQVCTGERIRGGGVNDDDDDAADNVKNDGDDGHETKPVETVNVATTNAEEEKKTSMTTTTISSEAADPMDTEDSKEVILSTTSVPPIVMKEPSTVALTGALSVPVTTPTTTVVLSTPTTQTSNTALPSIDSVLDPRKSSGTIITTVIPEVSASRADIISSSSAVATTAPQVEETKSVANSSNQTNVIHPVPLTSISEAKSGSSEPNLTEKTESKPAAPRVIPLEKVPDPQWEQHKPGENDEMQVESAQLTPKPDWYKPDAVSDIERTLLPEWFDGSAIHRTLESYLQAREMALKISTTLGRNRYITATMLRRSIPGDAGSLIRLHQFLTAHALLNADAINDSMPTPAIFMTGTNKKKRNIDAEALMKAVVEQNQKRPRTEGSLLSIDWDAVSTAVGNGVSASDCEQHFLSMSLEPNTPKERSITPDPTAANNDDSDLKKISQHDIEQNILRKLVENTDPSVISKVTQAALESTHDLVQAQRAAMAGLVASHVYLDARTHEHSVTRLLSEIVDIRMKKLENRLAMLDDVEGMLDAERLALELERRDLYTARCRHWFGGT